MKHTKKEIFKTLQDARVPSAPVRNVDEILNDPHMKQREFFVSMDHPAAGRLNSYPGVSYKYSKKKSRTNRPAPLLGEHNETIFCQQLGFEKDQLKRWRDEKVI
jgi:crotonobetainyl-CoA:carnitine CoA-transferase CaiB-like acyl-CoA transferase